jgi:hypothetical protein
LRSRQRVAGDNNMALSAAMRLDRAPAADRLLADQPIRPTHKVSGRTLTAPSFADFYVAQGADKKAQVTDKKPDGKTMMMGAQ